MASLPKTTAVSYEEWLRMPESEGGEEVVNGEIQPMPAARYPHARIIAKMSKAFMIQLDLDLFDVFAGSFGIIIRKQPFVSRTPDLAVFERSTLVVIDGYLHSAPQLAVEVLSPSESRKMKDAKLRDYQSIGVEEVWVVSPEAATVEVLLLEDGVLKQVHILSHGILKPKHFPDVQIDISRIWPD